MGGRSVKEESNGWTMLRWLDGCWLGWKREKRKKKIELAVAVEKEGLSDTVSHCRHWLLDWMLLNVLDFVLFTCVTGRENLETEAAKKKNERQRTSCVSRSLVCVCAPLS